MRSKTTKSCPDKRFLTILTVYLASFIKQEQVKQMSGWNGPTWSQWHGAAQEADQNYLIAEENFAAAQKWKAYAAKLEKELDEVWELYRDTKGNAVGQMRLKDESLSEIAKLDPTNRMLDTTTRKEIFKAAKDEELALLKQKY